MHGLPKTLILFQSINNTSKFPTNYPGCNLWEWTKKKPNLIFTYRYFFQNIVAKTCFVGLNEDFDDLVDGTNSRNSNHRNGVLITNKPLIRSSVITAHLLSQLFQRKIFAPATAIRSFRKLLLTRNKCTKYLWRRVQMLRSWRNQLRVSRDVVSKSWHVWHCLTRSNANRNIHS